MTEIPIDDEESGSYMGFLGKRKDMPFFMIRTGGESLSINKTIMTDEAPMAITPEASDRQRRSMVTRSVSGPTLLTNAPEVASEDEISLVAHSNPVIAIDDTAHDGTRDDYPSRSNGFRDERLESPEVRQDTPVSDGIPRALSEDQLNVNEPMNPHTPKPRSLCLTVSLSKSSFITPLNSQPGKATTLDVKIDVYFNGTLCASSYVPERCKKYGKGSVELTQRITGRRIAQSLERPWIIGPPEQRTIETSRNATPGDGGYIDEIQRWNVIAQALRDEAEKDGRDKEGELSMVGQYLECLSQLEMPTELRGVQKTNGPKFGVIDVVLTAGKGSKDPAEAGNVSKPTSMRVIANRSPFKQSTVNIQEEPKTQKPLPSVRSKPKTFADAHIIAQGLSFHAPRTAGRTNPTNNQTTTDTSKLNNALSASKGEGAADITSLKATEGPSTRQDDVFRTPGTPSAAPSAIRRRQSRAFNQAGSLSATRTGDHVTQQSMASLRSRSRFPQSPITRPPTNEASSSSPLVNQPRVRNREAGSTLFTTDPRTERSRRSTASIPSYSTEPSPKNLTFPGRHSPSNNTKIRLRSVTGSFVKVPDTSVSKPQGTPPSVPQKRYKSPRLSPDEPPKAKRSRLNYHVVIDDKMTLAEEMASIEATSKEEMEAKNQGDRKHSQSVVTRQKFAREKSTTPTPAAQHSGSSKHADESGNITVQGTPCPPAKPAQRKVSRVSDENKPAPSKPATKERQSKMVILRLKRASLEGGDVRSPVVLSNTPITACDMPMPSCPQEPTPNSEVVTPTESVGLPFRPSSSPSTTLDPDISTPRPNPPSPAIQSTLATPKPSSNPLPPDLSPVTTTAPSRRRRGSSMEIPKWPTPALSDNCVITFAPDIVRQVRFERPGWFKESSILMGVRFVVG